MVRGVPYIIDFSRARDPRPIHLHDLVGVDENEIPAELSLPLEEAAQRARSLDREAFDRSFWTVLLDGLAP